MLRDDLAAVELRDGCRLFLTTDGQRQLDPAHTS